MKIILSLVLFSLFSLNTISQWDIVDESDCAYNAVFFLNDSIGFVVGICGGSNITIKKTIDYGESWYIVHDTINAWIYDIYFPNDSIGYASTYENVLKTTNGGETWFYPTPEFEGYPYRSIVFQDNEIGFGCFGNGGIAFAKTIDGGITWFEQYDFGGLSLVKSDSCEVKMLGNGIWSSQDCATSWNLEPFDFAEISPLGFDYSAIDTSVMVCGIGLYDDTWQNYGFIAHRNGLFNLWEVQEFNYIYKLNALQNVNSSTTYCVGQPYSPHPYSFLKSIDGGETWFYQEYEYVCETCFTPEIRDVFCPSENVCYAVSGGGGIWRTLNGGGEMLPLPMTVTELSLNELSISPNPANDNVTISSLTQISEVQLFNSIGQLILSKNVNALSTNLDIANLEQGIYILTIKSDFGTSNKRLVKE